MSEETPRPDSDKMILPTGSRLVLSSSPHQHTPETIRTIMLKVILALLPACAAGIWFFGLNALTVIVGTTLFSVGAEALWCWLAKKPVKGTISDCSAILTGIILALNLPPGTPLWACLIGAFLAIWLGKQVFGGLGKNPFNPAAVARVGLLIAIPGIMTTWQPARGMDASYPAAKRVYDPAVLEKIEKGAPLDTVTCATPLGVTGVTPKITDNSNPDARRVFRTQDNSQMYVRYFFGQRGGCIGETSMLALLLGGLLLLALRLIDWRIPVSFLATVAVVTGAVNLFYPGVTPTPLFHLMTGGVMIAAFFMLTDMVTSPVSRLGAIVFAVGCGVITSVIRIWGNYPEGVSFSILLMNALVPLIDRWCSPRPFGYVLKKGEAK